jgi:hypothetical protein
LQQVHIRATSVCREVIPGIFFQPEDPFPMHLQVLPEVLCMAWPQCGRITGRQTRPVSPPMLMKLCCTRLAGNHGLP